MRQKRNGSHIDRYINDGIGYRMKTDVIVVATEYAYGEADTLSFRKEKPGDKVETLRVHDLKTGITPAKIRQLETYAAYFCIEYDIDPEDIRTIVQIYQNDQIIGGVTNPALIREIMTTTRKQDAIVREAMKEAM
jgi:hypothetical protein